MTGIAVELVLTLWKVLRLMRRVIKRDPRTSLVRPTIKFRVGFVEGRKRLLVTRCTLRVGHCCQIELKFT